MKKSNVFLNKKIIKKDFLNSLSAFTIVVLTLFVLFMVFGSIAPYMSNEYKLTTQLSQMLASKEYSYCFTLNDADAVPLVAPFIIAICQFAFLHQKDNCYTLLSFGIKREKVYRNRVAFPVIAMVLITLVIKGVALGFNIHQLYFSLDILQGWLIHVTIYLQMMLFIYSITVFCCHMCGRTVEAALASLSVIALPFVLSYLIKQVFAFSLYGYVGGNANGLSEIIDLINPIALEDFANSSEKLVVEAQADFTGRIIASLIWIAVSIALLVYTKKYFAKKYKPEISGFKGAKTGMVYVISLTAPLLFAYFGLEYVRGYFYPFVNTKVKLIAFLVAIVMGAIGAVLCNFVVHFTFKRIKVAFSAALSILAVIGITMLIGASGVFGTFNKLPDVSEIDSVSITAPFNNFILTEPCSESIDSFYSGNLEDIYITEEKDIQLVLDIHKQLLEDRDAQSATQMFIEYYLKDGTVVQREYTYLSDSALEKSLALWETEAVRMLVKGHLIPEKVFKPNTDDEFNLHHVNTVFNDETSIQIRSKHNVTSDITQALTAEQSFELRNAVQKDILAMSYREWFRPTDELLGTIYFKTVTDTHLGYGRYYYSNSFSFVAPVYDTMVNTLAVLNKYGLTDELTAQRNVTKLYVADLSELMNWVSGRPVNYDASDELIMPYYNNMNYISLEQVVIDEAPVKQITDKAEIEKHIRDGQSFYLMDNTDVTYVMAEFEGDEAGAVIGNCYIIP